MNRKLLVVLVVISLACISGGCTSEFGKPTNITLEQALTSVGLGLAGMRTAERSVAGAGGLIPQSVTITFNVGASASDNGSLSIQGAAPAGAPVTASGSASTSTTAAATRSNQITITLTNILFAPAGVLADNPDTLDKLLKTLKDHGYDLYVVDEKNVNPLAKSRLDAVLKDSQAPLNSSK